MLWYGHVGNIMIKCFIFFGCLVLTESIFNLLRRKFKLKTPIFDSFSDEAPWWHSMTTIGIAYLLCIPFISVLEFALESQFAIDLPVFKESVSELVMKIISLIKTQLSS